MTKIFFTAALALASLGLCSCQTSQFEPGAVERANATLREAESTPGHAVPTEEQSERISRLWADVPEYAVLARGDNSGLKAPRLISSVPPAYPLSARLANRKATVFVSFVVNEKGVVEAARVLESSDSRFDKSAIDAVLQWKFLPAMGPHGPLKASINVPLQFDGVK